MITSIDADASPYRVVVHADVGHMLLSYEFERTLTDGVCLVCARSGGHRVPNRDEYAKARRVAMSALADLQKRDDARFPHLAALRTARRP